jgi:ribosomal protein S18 acetylase RimI-like enzyme
MTHSENGGERTLDRKLLAYLRKSATRSPNHARIGPFVAIFRPDNDNKYLNYAIPDDDAAPTDTDIAALIAAFEERKRKPRLEYIPAAAPAVEAALLANGFTAERRVPVMLCTPGQEKAGPATPGIDIFAATSDDDFAGASAAQEEAYDGPGGGPAGLARTVKYGGVVAAARDSASNVIVGAGVVQPAVAGVSELSGIGTRTAYRRRGIAGAMTALLVREAFARGMTLLWLTPEDTDAQRIYARAGFTVASEALHISKD